jgi:C1A family cysteine protease
VRKIAARILSLGLAGLFVLAASGTQDTPAGEPHGTGLVPLDAVQLEGILANFPRITRVGLNPLGYERANAVRAARGLPALDPAVIRPLGGEVEAVPAGMVPATQAASATIAASGDLPVSVDNSQLRFFPPIRNQGSLGSCASFASTYVQLSYMTAFQRNLDIRNPADNTNKYSPKWSYGMLNDGENNGTSLYENYILLLRHGAATWAEFPYDSDYRGWCLDAATWRHALSVRTKAVQYVQSAQSDTGLALAKELLADGYVVVFGTYINSWVFKAAGDDPATTYDDAAAGKQVAYYMNGSDGSHAMTIVGYNDAVWTDINANGVIDAGERGAFRIANTWGTGWRESGFTWLAYDALKSASAVSGGPSTGRIAAIQGDLLYVLTARSDYAPLMVGEFTASHLKRNQLRLTLGRSGTTATIPTSTWPPLAFQNQGGAYAFDGSTTEVAGTFVLDFSDLLAQGAGAQRYYLGVSDSQTGSPATLSAFKIVDLTTDPATEAVSSLVPQTIDSQQAYAYVDYVYAGPAVNDPPTLASPQVSPASGNSGDTFTFNVRYSDPDGDAPAVKTLVLDGEARTMSLIAGQQAADGWYTVPVALVAGEHSYAFYFEDGKGESARAPLAGTISGPAVHGHVVTSLSPSTAMTGDPGFTLAVNGDLFVDGAVVTWDGADRTTTFVSANRLNAVVPASDLALGKTVPVVVRNPSGILSNAVAFTVSNPAPTLTSISPASLSGGGSGAVLTLRGSGFVPNTVMCWNGADRETTYISATEARGAVTADDLAAGGSFEVTAVNPVPGGGAAAGKSCAVADFTVGASPAQVSVTAGHAAVFTVEVTPQHAAFDAAVALSIAGLPSGASASFSPASVTPGDGASSVTLTVSTGARQGSAGAAIFADRWLGPPLGTLLAVAALLTSLALVLGHGDGAPWRRRLAASLLVLIAVGLSGCGAGGGTSDTDKGTPAGTYSLTIKGSSGSLSVEASVTLVVE